MKNEPHYPINDITNCLEQAQRWMKDNGNTGQEDRLLRQVFSSLAGDETIGCLAFAIWRERSRLFASLQGYFERGPGVLTTFRASLAQT